MKILYIAHYKESSGWSNAATQNVLALNSAGLDVVCRDIKLTNREYTPNPLIEELERKDLKDVTDCIQHVLPHHICATQKFAGKNISNYVAESMFTQKNAWHTFLDLTDEIWVPNDTLKQNTEKFVNKPVNTVPYAFDTSVYKKEHQKVNFTNHNSSFKFYTIADINERKNLAAIIRCYYHTFKYHENTLLVLKLSKRGLPEETLRQSVARMCQQIQEEMRLYKDISRYPAVRIFTEIVPTDAIYSIHQSCDCFVGISHGEGWSIPAFDAMCFGNKPICSDEGGPKMFIDKNDDTSGTLISGSYSICNHSDSAFEHIFTGSEFWFSPDEQKICETMRERYNNRERHKSPWDLGQQYSHEVIGQQMGELLK
jgi:hypothetical protein